MTETVVDPLIEISNRREDMLSGYFIWNGRVTLQYDTFSARTRILPYSQHPTNTVNVSAFIPILQSLDCCVCNSALNFQNRSLREEGKSCYLNGVDSSVHRCEQFLGTVGH